MHLCECGWIMLQVEFSVPVNATDKNSSMIFAVQNHCKCGGMNECCSVNVAVKEGRGIACTPHEVARMSSTINKALGITLDEALVYSLVKSVVGSVLRLFFLSLQQTCKVYI